MDFSISQPTEQLLQDVREWLTAKAYPLESRLFSHPFSSLLPRLRQLRRDVQERGWWCPQLTREDGSPSLNLIEFGLLSAELGRTPLGHFLFNCQAPDAGNMEILLELASKEQRERYLEPLISGQVRSCFAMTEPQHAGSNPVWMSTRAERQGDQYLINGVKWFTSSADGADFCIVMAVTDPAAEPHRRATMLLVPKETPGFQVLRNISCMGHTGDSWLSHSEIRFQECRVPVANRLGADGDGFKIAQQRLGPGRIHHCMRWIGICERAFEIMCQRAVERELSPGKPLAQESLIQDWVASSRAEIDAARWSVLHAAWRVSKVGSRDAREEISAIKFLAANTMQRVLDRAIQVCGALGITDDTPLSFFYRSERAARIYDGPDEVHKISLARRILRRYSPAAE